MIRVLFIWSDLRRPIGGAEYFLIDVIKYLKNLRNIQYAYVNVEDVKFANIFNLHNYDVAVIHSLNEVLALLPLLSMRLPVIIDVQSPDWLRYFREIRYGVKTDLAAMKRIYVKLLGKSFYCRVLNSFDYSTLGRHCKKVFLIPEFVDTNIFKPMREKYRSFTILVRYDPSFKGGFDIFLRALKHLGRSPWLNVTIIGRDTPKEVIAYIRRYVNNVYALGRVPRREDLALVYSRAHATVIPSRYESFSLTALESLSCGTPIIMSDLPPTEWFLKDIDNTNTGTGVRFRAGDPKDLASKIHLMQDIWNEERTYLNATLMSRCVAEIYDVRKVLPLYVDMIRKVYEDRVG
jgi:glycosyltransferase involved in cell wall biosynthesis